MYELWEGDFMWCRACWEIVRKEFEDKNFCGTRNLAIKKADTGEIVMRGEFND